jgi:thiamine pyrophosphokinase
MRVLIVAGGQPDPGSAPQGLASRGDRGSRPDWDLVIGADGGAAQALAWGLVPDIVVGDMDSLPATAKSILEAHGCRFLVHPRAKDETDLELALAHATGQGAQEIVILGAVGGRLDHTLANILLLAAPPWQRVSIRIVDGAQEAMVVRAGESLALRGEPGDMVSLLPLCGDVQGITTAGLAWPLRDDRLRLGYTRGISNEMTASGASVHVTEGLLLVVHGPAQASQALDASD